MVNRGRTKKDTIASEGTKEEIRPISFSYDLSIGLLNPRISDRKETVNGRHWRPFSELEKMESKGKTFWSIRDVSLEVIKILPIRKEFLSEKGG